MSVTIYTTGPACNKCNLTKKALTKAGVLFTEILLSDDPDAKARFDAKGYTMAPIVVTDDDEWSDFRIDKINGLIKAHAAAA